jgi:hypothetical protein
MSVLLSDLTSRLQRAAPARDGVPDADGYEQHVLDAVAQLSMDAPMRRMGSVALVSEQATYALPDDFLFLIDVQPVVATGDVLLTSSGIVPLGANGYTDRWEVEGDQLRVTPTPRLAMERSFRYAARHVLEETAFPLLNENAARVALLYAQYLVLMQQAGAVAGDGWKYSIGDESVDKSQQGNGLRAQAQALLDAYKREMRTMRGGFGDRARIATWPG